jgi:hypothetical protein
LMMNLENDMWSRCLLRAYNLLEDGLRGTTMVMHSEGKHEIYIVYVHD